jgi:heme oxygenase
VNPVLPFSQALREQTRSGHGASEGAGFMDDLITGRGSREDYISLVTQHYFIYAALEAAAETMRADAVAAAFISPRLTRLPALESDLEFLLGRDWRTRIAPLPTTARYVDRIRSVASTWCGGFIAHHYTRYLGDLSGGQIIRTLMQRQFGFETNGVGFFLFEQVAKPREFKDTYRAQLDRVDWSEEERERVISEVMIAYRFNTELFDDLARAKAISAA